MKLIDLNQTIFVPVVDETKGGMMVEMKMTVGEFFRKFCQGFEPNVVDAVPVVRCKDCMYFRPWRHDRGEDSRCEFWNAEIGAEDYCSQAIYLNNKMDGERRESE